MSKISGSHSATPKGDNGNVDPKASGQTTEMTEGPFKDQAKSGDNSSMGIVSKA